MAKETPSIACDLGVLPESGLEDLAAAASAVFGAADRLQVLDDGYELTYADASRELLTALARFIAWDRVCCPFLRHEVVTEAGGGPARLRLTGGRGAKEAIAAQLQRLVPDEVAAAAGLRPAG